MRGLGIEIRHIRYVAAAAECGSFRRAAQIIGVEQSAISRRIKEIEDRIGAKLFHRHCSGVELTDTGKRFLSRARGGVDEIRLALANCRGDQLQTRELYVGVFGPLTMGFLPELFERYKRANSDVSFRFCEGSCADLIAGVRRCEIDIAVVVEASPGPGYAVTPLWNEPVYLAMPERDPLADQGVVRWRDVRNRQFVVTDLPTGDFAKRYLQQHIPGGRNALRIEQLSVARESLMQIVAQDGGLTIAASAHARQSIAGIVFRPIKGAMLRYCAIHSSGALPRDLERVLVLARALSEREHSWFERERLIRPEHQRAPQSDRHRGARGRNPDRLL